MQLTAPIRPLYQAQTYRNLLFLSAGIPIAAVVLGLVIAGWTSIAVLAITPLVVPPLLHLVPWQRVINAAGRCSHRAGGWLPTLGRMRNARTFFFASSPMSLPPDLMCRVLLVALRPI